MLTEILKIKSPLPFTPYPLPFPLPTSMSDITVVLVEDHDVVRIGLRAVLAAPGIKTIGEAVNGVQGLKLLQSTPPDMRSSISDYQGWMGSK